MPHCSFWVSDFLPRVFTCLCHWHCAIYDKSNFTYCFSNGGLQKLCLLCVKAQDQFKVIKSVRYMLAGLRCCFCCPNKKQKNVVKAHDHFKLVRWLCAKAQDYFKSVTAVRLCLQSWGVASVLPIRRKKRGEMSWCNIWLGLVICRSVWHDVLPVCCIICRGTWPVTPPSVWKWAPCVPIWVLEQRQCGVGGR